MFFISCGFIFRVNLNVMKQFTKLAVIAFSIVVVASCRKEARGPASPLVGVYPRVLSQLRDSLSPVTYQALDTGQYFFMGLDSGRRMVIRVPFRGVAVVDSSVVVLVDVDGRLEAGRILRLWGTRDGRGLFRPGRMELRSLAGGIVLRSDVVDGHIVAFNSRSGRIAVDGIKPVVSEMDGGEDLMSHDGSRDDGGDLPDFVVIGYLTSGNEDSYVDIEPIFSSGDPADSISRVYMPVEPRSVGGGGGLAARPVLAIQPETEYTDKLKVVNIKNVFNCFDLVPDVGASYTMKLCVDVPVNSNPEALLNLSGAVSVGHTFLVLTKTNGDASITQSFGFYPGEMPSIMVPSASVPSAIKDNGGHEVNLSFSMSISAAQFGTVQTTAIADAGKPYVLTGYNCTGYALDVFNSVRSSPINSEPVTTMMPGVPGVPMLITQSPEGLFAVLDAMRTGGGPEAGNIQTDLSGRVMSPASHGECSE